MTTLVAEPWPDYALLDSGAGRKLERYGAVRVIRPEAQALWPPAAADWQAGGAQQVAPPTETPWRSLNARMEAPGGMQVTAFQELDPA